MLLSYSAVFCSFLLPMSHLNISSKCWGALFFKSLRFFLLLPKIKLFWTRSDSLR